VSRELFSAEQIAARVNELAAEIAAADKDAPREKPLLLVCILRGAFIFTADLARALYARGIDAEVDFLGLASYGGARQSQGRVRVTMDLETDVSARDILVIDDILDSGRTLSFVKHLLETRDAARVRTCVLLDKPDRRVVGGDADFTGFRVPDVFAKGYGMDVAGSTRGMPNIGTARDDTSEG
jgi:hypoxanthine phosphoribosyltransferase